jgi:hypothetical protein
LEDAALKKQQIDPALKKRFFFRVLDLQLWKGSCCLRKGLTLIIIGSSSFCPT